MLVSATINSFNYRLIGISAYKSAVYIVTQDIQSLGHTSAINFCIEVKKVVDMQTF